MVVLQKPKDLLHALTFLKLKLYNRQMRFFLDLWSNMVISDTEYQLIGINISEQTGLLFCWGKSHKTFTMLCCYCHFFKIKLGDLPCVHNETLRPGPIFARRHFPNKPITFGSEAKVGNLSKRQPDKITFPGEFNKVEQQDQVNTGSVSSFQRENVPTSKISTETLKSQVWFDGPPTSIGTFGDQIRFDGLRGSSSNSCSTNSVSTNTFSTNLCTTCSSREAKGWSSKSPPKKIYKYI